MEDTSSDGRTQGGGRGKLILAVISATVLVLGMVASIYYPFPSGETLSVGAFMALWFRELIIAGFVTILVGALVFARLRNIRRKTAARGKNAP